MNPLEGWMWWNMISANEYRGCNKWPSLQKLNAFQTLNKVCKTKLSIIVRCIVFTQNFPHLELSQSCWIRHWKWFSFDTKNVPKLVKLVLSYLHVLIKTTEHSKSLFHKTGYHWVQCRNESVTQKLLNGSGRLNGPNQKRNNEELNHVAKARQAPAGAGRSPVCSHKLEPGAVSTASWISR